MIVVRDMVVPNCVWKAGRVATAIRTTAVSCLWALLQSGVLNKDKVIVTVYFMILWLRNTHNFIYFLAHRANDPLSYWRDISSVIRPSLYLKNR